MEALQQLSNDSFSYSWLININPSSSSSAALDDTFRFSIDTADGGVGPFIEIDPRLASLRRMSDAHDFDFGLSGSQSPVLVHADQIFSNGLILPLRDLMITPLGAEGAPRSSDSFDSVLRRSLSLDSASRVLLSLSSQYKSPYSYTAPGRHTNSSPLRCRSVQSRPHLPLDRSSPSRSAGLRLPFVRCCGRTSKRIIQKYLCFLMPFYKKVKGLRLIGGRRTAGSPMTASSARSCTESMGTNNALSSIDWRRFSRTFDMGVEKSKSIHDAVLHCKKSIGRDE